jgi:hypothetical protein
VPSLEFPSTNRISWAAANFGIRKILDVAFFVAAGNDYARGKFPIREFPDRTSDDIGPQAKQPDPGQRRDESIDEWTKSEPTPRDQLPLLLTDYLETREIHQIQEIGCGDVIDFRLLAPQMQQFGELQDRLPQMGVIGDDNPRGRRAQMMHRSQRAVDIFKHSDGIGNHDVIKWPLDRSECSRILHVA